MKEKTSIIGAGVWGTTLAIILSRKGLDVDLHSIFPDHNLAMHRKRENALFLKGVKFPRKLNICPALSGALESKIIVIAIPVEFVREVLKKISKAGISLENKIFVSVSKGIEVDSLKRVSQIIKEELADTKVAVLSGPNIAREVLSGIPTTSVIVSSEVRLAKRLQVIFSTPTFRIYLHNDIIGVELGGALKNIIAIACGISDGLGFGTNTKAALVTRGLVEITRLGRAMGASSHTFWGLTGLGDLVTTCFSPYSRNRFVGEQIGKGKNLKAVLKKMTMVAEGVKTVKSAYKLSKKLKVEMPITTQIYEVLYEKKSPRRAVYDLMRRPLKAEKID